MRTPKIPLDPKEQKFRKEKLIIRHKLEYQLQQLND